MPVILWWGRSDPKYSRNRMVIKLLSELGWEIDWFRPAASQLGFIEAYLQRLARPDLIWVPCFRQKDIFSASYWAKKWGIPLILDPLISAYEKEVFERKKWLPDSHTAEKKRLYESDLFSKADIVVADTPAHAKFFNENLRVQADKISVLYVGAEANLFKPRPFPPLKPPLEILFYGSFLPLQGADVIVKAAQKTQNLSVRWTLLGAGEFRAVAEKNARGFDNINFEPWIDFNRLPARIAKAHVLLGIFGTTLKADFVIPNKIFQAMASGRPVITRRSKAYPQAIEDSKIIGWVSPGDPDALAALVRQWAESPDKIEQRGRETRQLFDILFSEQKLKEQLKRILQHI